MVSCRRKTVALLSPDSSVCAEHFSSPYFDGLGPYQLTFDRHPESFEHINIS